MKPIYIPARAQRPWVTRPFSNGGGVTPLGLLVIAVVGPLVLFLAGLAYSELAGVMDWINGG